jgi:diaminohydroxyphosphoribosylaminopyrimidine deaminase/5-amino-6-(5-phosphoribosylamino)uracil reductase
VQADPDARWMARALALAARGRYGASPNPMVGAVVLDANGNLVGEGFHSCFGAPHAEFVALAAASQRAEGGTLYVTLEPCAHTGKTPPCIDAIMSARIRRVVVATRDPNPVAGGGLERLAEAGMEIKLGVHGDSARRLNRRWLRHVQDGRPWVTLKAAVSLDGRIATRTGQSKWITGEKARRRSLELREEHDAILVGVATVIADDPLLTRRLGFNPSGSWRRIVLDSRLRTPIASRVVQELPEQTILVHGMDAPRSRQEALARCGVELLEAPTGHDDRIDLLSLLPRLAKRGIAALLVEGGAEVHGSFVDADLVDEVIFFVAPLIIGGVAPSAVAGLGASELALAHRLVFEEVVRHDLDLELRAVRSEAVAEEPDVHGVD